MHSATTRARASNTSAGETGSVSRQTMPLPSRHQALTREEQRGAARGQAGEQQSPCPTAVRRRARPDPGPTPSTIRPRRMPTERHTDPRSRRRRRARSAEPQRRLGHVACLVHARLHAQLLARRQARAPRRPGRAPSTSPVTVSRRTHPEGERPAPGLRGVREPRRGERPRRAARRTPGEVERGEDDDDRTGADADDEHAVRGASYALHGPADCLPDRGGGEDPARARRPGRRRGSRAASPER